MATVHTVLGILVLALALGGAGLLVRPVGERLSSFAGLALGALALQVMTGFFLATGTGRDVGAVHQFLPPSPWVQASPPDWSPGLPVPGWSEPRPSSSWPSPSR